MTLEEYLQKKYSQGSLKSDLYRIKKYTTYLADKAETAKYQDVLTYIEYLRKNYNLHPKTLRHYLYAVKIYYNYLVEIGKRKDHPCNELHLKDKISKQIQVDNLYSSQTLESFLEVPKKDTKLVQRRNQVIISLLIYQGLKVNEISQLELEDINLEKAEIYIKSSHHQIDRTLPLQAKQILLFLNYLQQDRQILLSYKGQNKDITTFLVGQYGQKITPNTINRMINNHRKPNQKLIPLKIRQSVIANLLKKEHNVRAVQVFAGHRRASTTSQYKQTELEILQNAVHQYHPL